MLNFKLVINPSREKSIGCIVVPWHDDTSFIAFALLDFVTKTGRLHCYENITCCQDAFVSSFAIIDFVTKFDRLHWHSHDKVARGYLCNKRLRIKIRVTTMTWCHQDTFVLFTMLTQNIIVVQMTCLPILISKSQLTFCDLSVLFG